MAEGSLPQALGPDVLRGRDGLQLPQLLRRLARLLAGWHDWCPDALQVLVVDGAVLIRDQVRAPLLPAVPVSG